MPVHSPTGFAEYDADKKQYSSLMSKRVSDEVMKHSAQARVYLMYSDYKPPVVASLSESDLLPESVEPGWNKQRKVVLLCNRGSAFAENERMASLPGK